MYLKQIEQLVDLQKVDNEILAIKAELDAAPKEVETLEGEFQTLEGQRSQIIEKNEFLKQQEKRLVNEIEEDNLRIKKSKNKLMMVGNTREYHAMMREMDNLEKLNRLREEEKITLTDELQRQDEQLAEIDTNVGRISGELDEKRANLQKRVDEAEELLNGLNKRRVNAGKSVPAPVLGRYEFIRSRLAHPVIVPVHAGICSGCNISITPQSFIELQKGQQILSCPNCQRLIYWCEHFQACDPLPAFNPPTPEVDEEGDAEAEA